MSSFKTYSWSVGTTSFRVKEVTSRIEKQLQILKILWENYPNESWENNDDLQSKYFDLLANNGLALSSAPRKAKDARQKTSSLKELGLINDGRKLTEVGEDILKLLNNNTVTDKENIFGIENDAYIYLKQLLKLKSETFEIRPFVATIYLINQLDYISFDEFTYLAPICHNSAETIEMVKKIQKIRSSEYTIEKAILDRLKNTENYKQALVELINGRESLDVRIQNSGLNRKSARYDIPYIGLYESINNLAKVGVDDYSIKQLKVAISKLTGKAQIKWKQLFFGNSLSKEAQRKFFSKYWKSSTLNTTVTDELLEEFFWVTHTIKWKMNLEEYADLNKRFFQLADILIFKDENIKLQLLAQHFFKDCILGLLLDTAAHSKFTENIELKDISSALDISSEEIINSLSDKIGRKLDPKTARSYLNDERRKQLDKLIVDKFSKSKLILLLKKIEQREDDFVQEYVTSNADVPTIFEYILAICWYVISENRFDLLESIRLSLDANMLPKTHASGGQGDIYIKYTDEFFDNPHNLLLEATLTNRTQQRKAEMEPVSRHLGRLMAENENTPSYCVFVSNYLDKNVINDFRGRKFIPYIHSGKTVKGMKILPIDTSLLVRVLEKEIKYQKLYEIFENAFVSDIDYEDWFNTELKEAIESL